MPTSSWRDHIHGPFSGSIGWEDVAARIDAHPVDGDPPAMREAFARLMLGASGPPDLGTADTLGGIDALRMTPAERTREGTAVWFHGGGYVFGSPETHLRPAAALAEALGVDVVLPRYRLAPEHPWPAQRDDALAAVRAVQPDGPVVVAGDSAGGHLALVTALALAEAGTPVRALALFSPNTDRTGQSHTREANTSRDPMNADEDDRQLAALTFPHHADDDPEVSPLLADLSRLPRTHIEVGAREVLLDDSRLLAARAHDQSASVSLHVEPEAFHMWQLWTPWLHEADASIARAATVLRDALAE